METYTTEKSEFCQIYNTNRIYLSTEAYRIKEWYH